VDVALRFSTGHGVPFHRVCELQRDVVKPREFAEWHLEGTQRIGCGVLTWNLRWGIHAAAAGARINSPCFGGLGFTDGNLTIDRRCLQGGSRLPIRSAGVDSGSVSCLPKIELRSQPTPTTTIRCRWLLAVHTRV
jgi:hypothetical protein